MNTACQYLGEIKAAISQFEEVQKKFGKFGACDTEPDGIFQCVVMDAFEKNKVEIPSTGRGWQLYSSMDCEDAALALCNACNEVVKLIVNFPDKDNEEFVRFIKDYCWRCR